MVTAVITVWRGGRPPFLNSPAQQRSPRAKAKKPADNSWRVRYAAAHYEHFKAHYPAAFKDGHYTPPKYPNVETANGLTQAICNYVDWTGGVGNRIKSEGRQIRTKEAAVGGGYFETNKFVKSTTTKGTADTDLTLCNGKCIKVEVKVGRDTPKEKQLKMQERIRKTGAVYEFIGNMIQFYELYDRQVNPELFL